MNWIKGWNNNKGDPYTVLYALKNIEFIINLRQLYSPTHQCNY